MNKITITCASESRIDKIRKARSLNDLMAVMKDIMQDVSKSKKVVTTLETSLSADEEISIDRTGVRTRERTIRVTRATPTSTTLGVKLSKFVVPSKDVLENNSKVVQDLYANAQELDSIEALLKQTFAGAKNQPNALRALRSLKSEIDATIYKALTALNSLAKKHIPSEMKTLNTRLVSFLLDYVDPKTYTDISKIIYVAPSGKDLHFSLYVGLSNLKDTTGYSYKEYYVVLTGIVDGSGHIRYFLNTLPDFKVPGNYMVGKEVGTEQEMLGRIKMLLTTSDILSEYERKPMPVNTRDLHLKKINQVKGVRSAVVDKDEIVLGLTSKTQNNVNAVLTEIVPLLNRVVGLNPRSKSLFKWALKERGGKAFLHFMLVPKQGDKGTSEFSINREKLMDLQRALELDDESIRRMVESLKGHL